MSFIETVKKLIRRLFNRKTDIDGILAPLQKLADRLDDRLAEIDAERAGNFEIINRLTAQNFDRAVESAKAQRAHNKISKLLGDDY